MAIECLVLGAGQEVGKSCVVVTMGGKRIMFDCGMHMGHHDSQRYPDFARILASAPGASDFTSAISCGHHTLPFGSYWGAAIFQ